MFHHVKDLPFNARVSQPDPRFARLLLEPFGGGNGELKAAMQYFTQAFFCRQPFPQPYDLLMSIATEEFSHLAIVGATIQTLLGRLNAELKDAVATNPVVRFAAQRQHRSKPGASAPQHRFRVRQPGSLQAACGACSAGSCS